MTTRAVTIGGFHITDGRGTMDVGDTEGDLQVGTPAYTPLSGGEVHAYLTLGGRGFPSARRTRRRRLRGAGGRPRGGAGGDR